MIFLMRYFQLLKPISLHSSCTFNFFTSCKDIKIKTETTWNWKNSSKHLKHNHHDVSTSSRSKCCLTLRKIVQQTFKTSFALCIWKIDHDEKSMIISFCSILIYMQLFICLISCNWSLIIDSIFWLYAHAIFAKNKYFNLWQHIKSQYSNYINNCNAWKWN